MKFTYTCKKVSLNDSVKAYAEKKVGKLEKFFKEEPEASVTFSVEKKNRCVAEIMLRGANGTLFRAVCEDPDGDMRGAIDEATAQIERKIRKNKTRLAKNLRAEAVLPATGQQIQVNSFCVVFFSAIVSPSFLSDIFHCVVSSLFRFCGYVVYQFMDVEHITAGEDAGDTALQILSHYRSSGLAVHICS